MKGTLCAGFLLILLCYGSFAQQPAKAGTPESKGSAKPSTAPPPPQPETALRWLQEKIEADQRILIATKWVPLGGRRENRTRDTITDRHLSFSGCAVESRQTWTSDIVLDDFKNHGSDRCTVSFQLADISPSVSAQRYETNWEPDSPLPWRLLLVAQHRAKKLHKKCLEDDGRVLENDLDSLQLLFSDGDIAKRAEVAIHDAVLACGGLQEPY